MAFEGVGVLEGLTVEGDMDTLVGAVVMVSHIMPLEEQNFHTKLKWSSCIELCSECNCSWSFALMHHYLTIVALKASSKQPRDVRGFSFLVLSKAWLIWS